MSNAAPKNDWIAMVRTMGVVSLLSGVLIVMAYEGTAARIALNRQRATEAAVFAVLPGAVQRATFSVGQDSFTRVEGQEAAGPKVYAGFDAAGKLVGVAIQASAQGYQDTIRALYGYDPARECIIGLKVLESKETPGLGDKIATSEEFLRNFEALRAGVTGDGRALEHPIELSKRGMKPEAWQIDGISGATISSKAVARALNDSAQRIVPLVKKHVDQFTVK